MSAGFKSPPEGFDANPERVIDDDGRRNRSAGKHIELIGTASAILPPLLDGLALETHVEERHA